MSFIYNYVLESKKNQALQDFYKISNDKKINQLDKNDYMLFIINQTKQNIERSDSFSELGLYKSQLDSIKNLLCIF